MYTWFTVKVKFERQGEDAQITKVTEPFLIDAMSYTEAEKRILKEVRMYATAGELEIVDIKKTKLAELYPAPEGGTWFRCKINYLAVDENKGVEKKIAQIIMVQAENFRSAVDTLIEKMKGTLGDYEIAMISETNILDVYQYEVSASIEANETK